MGRTVVARELLTSRPRFSDDLLRLTEEAFGREGKAILSALPLPVSTYYVRCNTSKISPTHLALRLTDEGLQISQHPNIPEALGIRVEGPFDFEGTGREVVVDRLTAESVLQGANVYAPGIVGCSRLSFGDRVTVVSEWGDSLGTGRMLMSTHEILNLRKGLAIKVEQRRYNAPQVRELTEYSAGLLYPQSLAAMAASRALDPQPGETVLDMNCAPGGKLSHLSQLMQNSGKIVGLDRNPEKISATRRTVTSLGCTNVTLVVRDSRHADMDFADLKPDRVMLDPPCTALGLRPKIYDNTTHKKVDDLASYQKQFLKAAGRVVKQGGTVVYSVCTYTNQECESAVEFAEKECNLKLIERPRKFSPTSDEIGYFIAKFEK